VRKRDDHDQQVKQLEGCKDNFTAERSHSRNPLSLIPYRGTMNIKDLITSVAGASSFIRLFQDEAPPLDMKNIMVTIFHSLDVFSPYRFGVGCSFTLSNPWRPIHARASLSRSTIQHSAQGPEIPPFHFFGHEHPLIRI
jgi:hypothetical protein